MPWCTEMYWVSGHDATPEKEKQAKSVVRHRVFSYDATPEKEKQAKSVVRYRVFSYDATPEKENSSEASSNLNPSPTFFLKGTCSTIGT